MNGPVMREPAQPLLQVRGLCAELDTPLGIARAIDALDLEVNAGETVALLGESGCGKSMSALALMRLLPEVGYLAGGSVRLAGRELTALSEAQMRAVRGGDIAMIFQEPSTSLNPVLTVLQQIAEVLIRHRGLDAVAARRAAQALLDQVGIPDAARRLDEYPFQFSGGMKQRVMIAMALAGQPRLLIADEPTTALDVTIQAQVLDLLAGLQAERGMGLLLITHDLGVVARMAHRVSVMYAGQVVETAPRGDFFARPLHPYSRKLFEALPEGARLRGRLASVPGSVPSLGTVFRACRFAERCPAAWSRCHEAVPAWHVVQAGHGVRCHLYDGVSVPGVVSGEFEAPPPSGAPATPRSASPLLQLQGLEVHFPIRRGLLQRVVGHVKAVDGVSFSLWPGQTLALVGESGCGKTTVGKAILRLIEPTAGQVSLEGESLIEAAPARLRSLRARMQMVFQDPFGSLNPRLRVGEIIAEGITALGGTARGEHARRVATLLEQVGLRAEMSERFPHEFSGGQRQRIAIARALAVSPRLLVCDEPTSALDVSVQAQILNLLQDLQRELGLAYLFITHNISVVEHLADRIAVMYLGRIVESGPVADILAAPRHPYTAALLSAVPRVHAPQARAIRLHGDLPSPAAVPSGCRFHPRCPQVREACRRSDPAFIETGVRGVACLFPLGDP